jgi:hypothetical protein
MRDKCKIGTLQVLSGGLEPVTDWDYGSSVRCRFAKQSTSEIVDGNRRHVTTTQIHLPASVTISSADNIQITHRNTSVLVDPEFYAVIGDPWRTIDNKVVVCTCERLPAGVS